MSIPATESLRLFATTPKGLELLLVDELRALGAQQAAEKLAGVEFQGDLALAYRACLWSRLANRILLQLAKVPAATPEALYAGVQTIAWHDHMDPEATIAVNFVSAQSQITHTLFGAQKVKDAIVDQLRQRFQTRPSVAREHPDISVNVYLHRDIATISLDLSGDSLHRRNYRLGGGGIAPLKENLAAAILLRAGWPQVAKTGGMLLDPMAGSGTLLIEGALLAADIAPGLGRDYFGFLRWKKHAAALWQELLIDAKARREAGLKHLPPIVGYDIDTYAVRIAFENIERAGLLGKVHVEKRALADLEVKETSVPGLVVVNPPYGERIGEATDLQRLYALLGDKFKTVLTGWRGAVFTGNSDLAKQMGLRARKYYALMNGAIPCQLLLFDIVAERFIDRSPATQNERRIAAAKRAMVDHDLQAVTMFTNRLRKNAKQLKRWVEREAITSYRLYDADLPEYAFSVDRIGQYVLVQEYPAPKTVDSERARLRQQEVLSVIPEALDVPASHVFFHVKPRYSYEPEESAVVAIEQFTAIPEAGLSCLVNLELEGLGTGLMPQQRALRQWIKTQAQGAHVLHLFATSGAMTVMAAAGKALSTKTVVNSVFYYQWVKQALARNGLAEKQHQVVTSDPFLWAARERTRYHLIVAELPLLEDYESALYEILKLLLPEGMLIFATQDKRFEPDARWFPEFTIRDMTTELAVPDVIRPVEKYRFWLIA